MFPLTMFYIVLAVCAVGSVERYDFVDAALVDRSYEGSPQAYQVDRQFRVRHSLEGYDFIPIGEARCGQTLYPQLESLPLATPKTDHSAVESSTAACCPLIICQALDPAGSQILLLLILKSLLRIQQFSFAAAFETPYNETFCSSLIN